MYPAGVQLPSTFAGYQNRTINSRFVPFSRKGSSRLESIRRISLVPTAYFPEGAGVVAVPNVVNADKVGFAVRVCLICFEQEKDPVPDNATN